MCAACRMIARVGPASIVAARCGMSRRRARGGARRGACRADTFRSHPVRATISDMGPLMQALLRALRDPPRAARPAHRVPAPRLSAAG